MPSLKRRLRNSLKRGLHAAFRVGQRLGVDLLPRHFYSPIPDLRHLRRTTAWRKPTTMAGVQGAEIDGQLRFAADCCTPEVRQRLAAFDVHAHAIAENGEMGYGPVEAAFLYAFIFTHRPPRVVQVGAGVSTAIILRAAADAGYAVQVTAVDPYPTRYLSSLAAAGKINLVPEPAQEVNLNVLTDLGPAGLLFVDSTHTVKAGSEVNRIVLEVLPRLAATARVHFHDILFPYDYTRVLFQDTLAFSSESTLLQAFLACNSRYRISAALSMLHYAAPDRLRELIPTYRPQPNDDGLMPPGAPGHFPSATYLVVS